MRISQRSSIHPGDLVVDGSLTCGLLAVNGEDSALEAVNELARIGVSIEDLTMGTGVWGADIWADYRAHPLGWEYRPGCIPKNS